jgi:stage V sporulation protein K
LFLGNAGTGKTTVANLLAEMMVELQFRKNSRPIFTSANDILAAVDPVACFSQMIVDSKDGTCTFSFVGLPELVLITVTSYTAVFIDEAYNFQPAPRGSTANASNKVLDLLMKSCEMEIYRSTTTFILAGYKDELLPVLGYNQGFASRFPITFEFPDYTVPQLQKILVSMIKERGLTVASKATCGVNIPLVLARVSCVATDILIEIAHLCVITFL